jgi:hypothetical protein
MIQLFESEKEAESISILSDPFKSDKIEKIHMWIMRGIFDRNQISFSADVSFKNGSTSGKQEITADNFPDLCLKVQAFVQGL